MTIETQLSIFLDNRPGMLAHTCETLANAGINILALSISDTVDHVVIRLVVSNPKQALKMLEQLHGTVHQREVILMEVPNAPGALAKIAEKLASTGINIEYAYCTSLPSQTAGSLVIRTNNLEETFDVLND